MTHFNQILRHFSHESVPPIACIFQNDEELERITNDFCILQSSTSLKCFHCQANYPQNKVNISDKVVIGVCQCCNYYSNVFISTYIPGKLNYWAVAQYIHTSENQYSHRDDNELEWKKPQREENICYLCNKKENVGQCYFPFLNTWVNAVASNVKVILCVSCFYCNAIGCDYITTTHKNQIRGLMTKDTKEYQNRKIWLIKIKGWKTYLLFGNIFFDVFPKEIIVLITQMHTEFSI
jgi:hypothetical protein